MTIWVRGTPGCARTRGAVVCAIAFVVSMDFVLHHAPRLPALGAGMGRTRVVAIVMALAAFCACTSKSATGDSGDSATTGTLDDTAIAADTGEDPGPVDTSKPDSKADASKPVCNPLQNTGCTDPALARCAYGTDGKPECQKAGTAKLGEACTNPEDCAEGLCLGCPTGKNVCANFCISDASCQPKQTCNQITDQKYKVCDFCTYESCKVEVVTCANAKQACYIGGPNGPVCMDKGTAAKGDTCKGISDCDAGLACTGLGGTALGVCRAVCRVDGKLDCNPPTQKCENVDGSGYGFCPN